MSNDGATVVTMFDKLEAVQSECCILLMQDAKHRIFGAFCVPSLKRTISETEEYFGTGECFVFTFRDDLSLHVYKTTGSNDFQLLSSEQGGLGVGGGNDFALRLDRHFSKGQSSPCDTYASPCLAGSQDFECFALEIWAPTTDMT
jgi:hypothetical protein